VTGEAGDDQEGQSADEFNSALFTMASWVGINEVVTPDILSASWKTMDPSAIVKIMSETLKRGTAEEKEAVATILSHLIEKGNFWFLEDLTTYGAALMSSNDVNVLATRLSAGGIDEDTPVKDIVKNIYALLTPAQRSSIPLPVGAAEEEVAKEDIAAF